MSPSEKSQQHLTDDELIHWVDEPRDRRPEAVEHMRDCNACQQRVEEIEMVIADLREEPPMVTAEAFSAQRERIVNGLRVRSGDAPPIVRSIRRWWWVPTAAAAAVIALMIVSPDNGPGTRPTTIEPIANGDTDTSLAVIRAADRAAEEAALVVAEGRDVSDELSAGSDPPFILEEAFESLPEDAQTTILAELAEASFDL